MQLIPPETLAIADKILFIAHLAIGDFTYLQNFFNAFSNTYPHIKIDLWVDEVRCTSDQRQWPFLKKYSLYDWVEQCAFFRKVYRRTYSPELRKESIGEAQQEQYPVVVSLATLRPHNYANLAREIGPNAHTVGMKNKVRWYAPREKSAYAKLDASFAPFQQSTLYKPNHHITDVYADWFHQLCNLKVTEQQRFPFVNIPTKWLNYAQHQLEEWEVLNQKIVFINAYAKTKKRCWSLASVAKLIATMRQLPAWKNALFIVNAVPQERDNAKRVLSAYHLKNTHLFSAEENFFQLPAILQRCHLIISVETAVMHLANAVHVPLIALMRQKNPEWVPIDKKKSTVITTKRRRDWVDAITVHQISAVLPLY